MEKLAVCAEREEWLAQVRKRFEKAGIAADYTTRAAEAARYPAAFVPMPAFDLTTAERIAAMREVGCGVIVAARPEHCEKIRAYFRGKGIAVLKLPLDADLFRQTVAVTLDVSSRFRAVLDENEALKSKLNEMKLVDRAKCALIQYLGMTEKEAHRFIEKQAMNKRVSRREIALEVLKTYES